MKTSEHAVPTAPKQASSKDVTLVEALRNTLRMLFLMVPDCTKLQAGDAQSVVTADEMGLRRAFSAIEREQERSWFLDDHPEALVSYTIMLEGLRRKDGAAMQGLRVSRESVTVAGLPPVTLFGAYVAQVSGMLEVAQDETGRTMHRMTLAVVCGRVEQRLVLCEWAPEAYAFAPSVCDVIRVGSPAARAQFPSAAALIFMQRLGCDILESMIGHIGRPPADVVGRYRESIDAQRIALAKAVGLIAGGLEVNGHAEQATHLAVTSASGLRAHTVAA